MSSQSNNFIKNTKNNENENNNEQINLGGFPPIMYLGQKNKKIKEFAQLNSKNESFKNISKLNILNIKNILGV
jgi:hypothetical protein